MANPEIRPTQATHESGIRETLDHSGSIELSVEETAILDSASQGEFIDHPNFTGVQIQAIETAKVPAAIKEIIDRIGGKITVFTAVKIKEKVPLHQHTADGEIYFNGKNGTVTLFDAERKTIGEFQLGKNNFTQTNINEWHAVKASNEEGAIFFGVKFTIVE